MVRRTAMALLVVLGCQLLVVGAGVAGRAAPRPAHRAGQTSVLVTLVTGDRVRVGLGAGGTTAAPVAPRAGVVYATRTDHGDTYLVPSDAAALLAAGRLDQRLFDVSLLVRDGYDDAHRADLPLLESVPRGRRAPAVAGARTTVSLASVGITAVTTRKADAARFWAALRGTAHASLAGGVTRLWLDGRVRASADQNVTQIGAPTAWAAGYTGSGVPVAVLDTGLDASHPDLAGQVTASRDFTGSADGTADDVGHGTHVASILAGTGAASGGEYEGVAPGARLLIGRVLDASGGGYDSWLLAGMQWAVDQHARVVNLSLGDQEASDGTDPVSQALDTLSEASGTLFVVAAGNREHQNQVTSPAAADDALAVGAVDGTDAWASFSDVGPRLGDYAVKPDISAPGVDITAARAAGSDLGRPVGQYYQTLSGTSMAAPHVAGAAAILAQQHPDWTADRLKAALMSTAHPAAGATVYQQGAGRVDVARAVAQPVTATGSASFGYLTWPHTGQQPVARPITYRNDGDSPISLALSESLTDQSGAAAPDGTITLSASTVTVPAHGTATVTATLDPATATPGQYGGWLTATGDGATVRTALGGYDEPERHTLTVTLTDRAGATPAAGTAQVTVLDRTTGTGTSVTAGADGTAVLRLPPDDLAVVGTVYETDGDQVTATDLVAHPRLRLTADTALSLPASTTRPVTDAVDAADAHRTGRGDGWFLRTATGYLPGADVYTGGGSALYTATDGPAADDFVFADQSSWTQPDATLTGGAGQPVLTLNWAPTSPRANTDRDVTLVDGGNGSPAALAAADLAGHVVVVHTDYTQDPTQVAADVAAGGGTGLVIDDVYDSYGPLPIPVLTAPDLTGLLAGVSGGPATLHLRTTRSSRYEYDLVFTRHGGLPDGAAYRGSRDELATLHESYGSTGGDHGMIFPTAFVDGAMPSSIATNRTALPATRDHYVTADATGWQFGEAVGDFFDADTRGTYAQQDATPRTFRPGQHVTDRWNAPVFAPRLDTAAGPVAYRTGDTLTAAVPMLTDAGTSHVDGAYIPDPGTTTLTAGGTPVTTGPGAGDFPGSGQWTVPPAAATYQLTAETRRDGPEWQLSTDVTARWTFRSAHVTGDAAQPLPLVDARYQLATDPTGTVPAGTAPTITVSVGHQPGTDPGTTDAVTAQVSLDDGKTWSAAPVHRVPGGRWQLAGPAGGGQAGYVSLRLSVTTSSGSSLDETILHAYRWG